MKLKVQKTENKKFNESWNQRIKESMGMSRLSTTKLPELFDFVHSLRRIISQLSKSANMFSIQND